MKSTFSRAFFPATIILLAALLLVGTAFQALVRNYLKDRTMEGLKNDCSVITQMASAYHSGDALTSQDFLVNLSVVSRVSEADSVICDATGKLVLCSDAPAQCSHHGLVVHQKFFERVLSSDYVTSTGYVRGLYDDPRYVVSAPIRDAAGKAVGIVIMSVPLEETQQVLRRLSDIYLVVSVLVILVSVIVMSVFARRQSRPLRQMAQAAVAFGHGDFNARVHVDKRSTQEIQELALAFNNMAASLEKTEYQHKEFVANVSHELKTPMTTIAGYIDGILDGTIPPQRQEHYLRLVSQETKRLSRLVRSMLDISRLQHQGSIPEESMTQFDITECVGQTLISFEQAINEKNLQVEVQMPEHALYTFANRDYIVQVLYNLLDNGVKFCPHGGNLALTIRQDSQKIYCSVRNDGPTIPPEELPLVFDRFHKLDKSRSENREGWGLGLYIVKTIIGAHGEDLSVTSQDGQTEFTFTLPLY